MPFNKLNKGRHKYIENSHIKYPKCTKGRPLLTKQCLTGNLTVDHTVSERQ